MKARAGDLQGGLGWNLGGSFSLSPFIADLLPYCRGLVEKLRNHIILFVGAEGGVNPPPRICVGGRPSCFRPGGDNEYGRMQRLRAVGIVPHLRGHYRLLLMTSEKEPFCNL
jgi:hypothetical protein